MKNTLLILTILSLFLYTSTNAKAQDYIEWENEDVDEFYIKKSVKRGTLSQKGNKISFILEPTEMKPGVYEVEITDHDNDIYEIKNTDYFVKFRGYYGYAGYGDEGILVVGSSSWSSTFYKKP